MVNLRSTRSVSAFPLSRDVGQIAPSRFLRPLLMLFICAIPCVGVAEPVFFDPAEGGNGHWYELVNCGQDTSDWVTWEEASALAELRECPECTDLDCETGYLATLTSQDEYNFVLHVVVGLQTWPDFEEPWAGPKDSPFLGGYEDPDTLAWKWISGEPWDYTAWNTSWHEPNGTGDNDTVRLYASKSSWDLGWADIYLGATSPTYVVEWGCPEGSEPGATEWPVSEGGNGHFYKYVAAEGATWDDARQAAEGMTLPGHEDLYSHLVTIESEAENRFVLYTLLGGTEWPLDDEWAGPYHGPWIGAYENGAEGLWTWVNGEQWDYSGWNSAWHEPNEPGTEDRAALYVSAGASKEWKLGWADFPRAPPEGT